MPYDQCIKSGDEDREDECRVLFQPVFDCMMKHRDYHAPLLDFIENQISEATDPDEVKPPDTVAGKD